MRNITPASSIAAVMMVVFCLCIGLSGTPALGVDVTFSDPLVINNSQTYYYPALFEPDYEVSDLVVGEGPEFDLILMKISSEKNWSMALVGRDGQLVDTIPRYLHPLSVTLSYYYDPLAMAAVSWIEPYYYIFESRHDTLFYTRVAADLTVIDSLPVPYLTGGFEKLLIDCTRLWVISKRVANVPFHLTKYEFPDTTPMTVDIEIPESFDTDYRGMALGADTLSFENDLYLYAVDEDSLTISVFRVTSAGEVDTLARADCRNVKNSMAVSNRVGFIPITGDSLLFCWLFKASGQPFNLCYYKLSGIHPTDTIEATVIDMPDLSVGSALSVAGFHYDGNNVYAIGNHSENDLYSRLVRLKFDLTAAAVEYTELYAEEWPYYSTNKFAYHENETLAHLYYINGPRVNMLTFGPRLPQPPVIRVPVLYRSRADRRPTFLTDNNGILLYLQKSGSNGPALEGYRFGYDLISTADSPFPLITDDIRPTAPRLYDLDDRRALYWCNYCEEGLVDGNLDFVGKLVIFDGDQPPIINNGDRLRIGSRITNFPPAVVRTDSFVYVNQYRINSYYDNWTPCCSQTMAAVNLFPQPSVASRRGSCQAGLNALAVNGDTALVVSTYAYCIVWSPTMCWEREAGYSGNSFVNGTFAAAYLFPELGHYVSPPFMDISANTIGGSNVFSTKSNYVLSQLDYSTMRFASLVDLQVSSGGYFGHNGPHDYTILPVETDNAIAVFFLHDDYNLHRGFVFEDCHLMIFDKQWNFKYASKLSFAGIAKDMGDIRYSPEADKIFYAYSTYLPDQYVSPRVVLQSMTIDNITSADDHPSTVPETFRLWQNVPNPFNASTRIDFNLPVRSQVTITVYNLLGQRVKTVLSAPLESGRHSAFWDGTDNEVSPVASGVYIYQVRTEHDADTRKMILLK